MPTWTSNVTNVPNIQQKQQDFQNLINSVNQFAGVMYNVQQAKQAEQIRNLTATGEVIGKLPKTLQSEATKNILVPMLEKMMPGSTKSFNWDKVVDFPKAVEGMKQFKDDSVGLQKYIATVTNLFTSDEIKGLQNVAKAMTESDKQTKLAENLKTFQGIPTTTVSSFQTALPQGTPGVSPQFAGEGERTTIPTSEQRKAAFLEAISTEQGLKAASMLVKEPKAREGQYLKNADTGETRWFDKGDKIEPGTWYTLGNQPAEKTPTDYLTFYNAGKEAGLTEDQISKNWKLQKIEIARASKTPKETADEAVKKARLIKTMERELPPTPEQKRLERKDRANAEAKLMENKDDYEMGKPYANYLGNYVWKNDEWQQIKTQPQTIIYKSADDVKTAFKAGKIDKSTAIKILRKNFGMK